MPSKYHADVCRDVPGALRAVEALLTHGPLRLRPLRDYVIVRRLPDEGESAGGIAIPGSVNRKARPGRGVVVAVGPGKPLPGGGFAEVPLSRGDVVLYWKFLAEPIYGIGSGPDSHESELYMMAFHDGPRRGRKPPERGAVIAVVEAEERAA